MSQEVFMRGLFSGLLSLAFAWAVFSRQDEAVSVSFAASGSGSMRLLSVSIIFFLL